ncbi:IS630 family transposase [Bradyrhizobium brasilense]|uniref:IS630 family transposase n=1 Tax=Bradyrhizobium brasilense TaxID=1419277 RepID=UPI0024B0A71A|nr:IS630 family transposase [Bradyrhizobium australafricanum]WFU31149.1 IS630 family transposase [Bradyrhizobium australafricanum]
MTRPHSEDIRERAMARADAGETVRSIAEALQISPSLRDELEKSETGYRGPGPGQIGGHKKRVLSDTNADCANAFARGHLPCASWELTARGIKTGVRAVWTVVHAEELSFKKTLLPAEQDRPDVARKRTCWKAHQGRIDVARLVFIDKTWIKTSMAPLRGWRPCGQRLQGSARFGHWKTMTFIAALRHDQISAPWMIDGPINGELFTLYVEKVLAPTLAPGEIVVLDNLDSHKGKAACQAIGARGAHRIFLPPYSPDLDPIEQVFTKLKHLMRAAPRDVEAAWRKVGKLLNLFRGEECTNYLKTSGYALCKDSML